MKYISVILIVGFLANCATGDVWDDAHTIQRFKEELADATMKQLECRTGLTDLWIDFKKSQPTDREFGVIRKVCADKAPLPERPSACE